MSFIKEWVNSNDQIITRRLSFERRSCIRTGPVTTHRRGAGSMILLGLTNRQLPFGKVCDVCAGGERRRRNNSQTLHQQSGVAADILHACGSFATNLLLAKRLQLVHEMLCQATSELCCLLLIRLVAGNQRQVRVSEPKVRIYTSQSRVG